jgi:LPS sulfotransferase NodH
VAREHGVTTRQGFLDLVYRLGTTDNGVFGIKVMWNNLSWAIGRLRALPRFRELSDSELLVEVFPDLHVVQIVRQDRLGQAISWARAAQDGTWVMTDSSPAAAARPPVYDFDLIRGLERLVAEGEAGWRQLVLDLDLQPYVVTYEHLSTEDGYHATVSGVADHLGVELGDIRLPRPRSRRQADHTNDEWRQRYLEDVSRAVRSGRARSGSDPSPRTPGG